MRDSEELKCIFFDQWYEWAVKSKLLVNKDEKGIMEHIWNLKEQEMFPVTAEVCELHGDLAKQNIIIKNLKDLVQELTDELDSLARQDAMLRELTDMGQER